MREFLRSITIIKSQWLIVAAIIGIIALIVIPDFVADEPAPARPGRHLTRTVDAEAGVVCYRFSGFDGISCLPLSSTKLGHGEREP